MDEDRWSGWEPLYPLVMRLLQLLLRFRFDVRTGGRPIPPTGPVLLAANHPYHLDPVVFASVAHRQGRRTRFLALADLWSKRLVGWMLRKGRMIPVRPGRGPEPMVADACAALRAGQTVLIYPEGHLERDRADLPAKPGAGLLALSAGVPVIPMALWGLGPTAQPGRRLRRRRIGVVVGEAVDLSPWSGRSDKEASRQAADAVLADIRSLLPQAEALATTRRR